MESEENRAFQRVFIDLDQPRVVPARTALATQVRILTLN
jgi:hypothetical protein